MVVMSLFYENHACFNDKCGIWLDFDVTLGKIYYYILLRPQQYEMLIFRADWLISLDLRL